MPSKKSFDSRKESPVEDDVVMLLYGQRNNITAGRDAM